MGNNVRRVKVYKATSEVDKKPKNAWDFTEEDVKRFTTVPDMTTVPDIKSGLLSEEEIEKAKEQFLPGSNEFGTRMTESLKPDETSVNTKHGMDSCAAFGRKFQDTIKPIKTEFDEKKKKLEDTRNDFIKLIDEVSEAAKERVDHPDYYNLTNGPYVFVDGKRVPIECIDVIRDMPLWKGNVFKYLWRCGVKTEAGLSQEQKELEDMEKALWYLKDKINTMKMHKQ